MSNRFFSKQAAWILLEWILLVSVGTHGFAEDSYASDAAFLRKVQKDSLFYFVRFSDPMTGLTLDSSTSGAPASIAATGFSLAALAIGYDQGWISYTDAHERILQTLNTLHSKAQHENGFFYHFLDPATGKRIWGSEVSSIDTALLLAGALLAGQYFKGTEVETLAQKLYERVRWPWMLNGREQLCMGWTPESGFLPYYWSQYSEHLILLALAIGAPRTPIPAPCWRQWDRLEDEYKGKRIVYSHTGSLFTYQYAQAFIDFRNRDDHGINYFDNSVKATWANRQFCRVHAGKHKTYGPRSWGLTACLGPGGYKAYGAKPGLALNDGTIAPYGAAASIVFTPKSSIQALRFFYNNYAEKLYGPYGFKDGFNLDKKWFSDEYLGIDQGITVLMVENFLSEGVWKRFMQLPAIQRWARRCFSNQGDSH